MVCVGFGIYGVLNIKLDYDAIWFMDQKSYQTQYFKRFEEAFPDQGERVEVYIGECKIYLSYSRLSTLGVSPSLVARYCEGYSFWSIWGP